MHEHPPHHSHSEIIKRLRRVEGHLRNVIDMVESERSCLDIAQQMHAVEKAIGAAKKVLIHDHIIQLWRASCNRHNRRHQRQQGNLAQRYTSPSHCPLTILDTSRFQKPGRQIINYLYTMLRSSSCLADGFSGRCAMR